MTEEEYWLSLEYRVSAEFGGLKDRRVRFLGCDGFVPDEYLLEGDPPSIRGRAWILGGPAAQWDFVLILGQHFDDRSSIDWSTLLPGDDVTGWLAPDVTKRFLEIEPAAATPES